MSAKIELVEDTFGILIGNDGKQRKVQRFTWRNHNNIEVQAITYGARVISLKLPNRKGVRDDVVLGFDNMAGYLFYEDLYLGATVGRVTNKIENATFAIDDKQFWLSANSFDHHENGGSKGFDKALWTPYVDGKKVIMHHISHDGDQGYPGDLMVRVTFELLPKNEFHIEMDATTTKPTIVALSNVTFFNLAGHSSGPEELYKHEVSINSNCYTPYRENGLPTGEIMNVVYTDYDFQTPKVLGKTIEDGIDQLLCVNRAVDQDNCFVARAYHPPSGRILEIYSDQFGINFSTANHFTCGVSNIPLPNFSPRKEIKDIFDLIDKLHGSIKRMLKPADYPGYKNLRDIIRKTKEAKKKSHFENDTQEKVTLDPLQAEYLEKLRAMSQPEEASDCSELCAIICEILDNATIKDPIEIETSTPDVKQRQKTVETWRNRKNYFLKKAGAVVQGNKIPSHYESAKIYGKKQSVYKRHGAMCFQTQNYIDAIHHKNFPSAVLHPGQTYRHNIVYKFWIMSGTPKKSDIC